MGTTLAMSMTLVVLAAGVGSRFGGLKQAAGLGPAGETLFDYAVYDAIQVGFDDVVFVVSDSSISAVEPRVEEGCGRHVPVRFAVQKTEGRSKPWGTGHAVLTGCEELSDRFAVINADDFYGRRSFELLAQELRATERDHVLVAFRLRETLSPNGGVSRGVCVVEDGFLASITELHDVVANGDAVECREDVPLTGDELISTNLWGFRPSFCQALGEEFDLFLGEHRDDADAEFLIGDAVAALRKHGDERVRVVPTTERFHGITYADDVEGVRGEIAALIDAGQYPSPLWA